MKVRVLFLFVVLGVPLMVEAAAPNPPANAVMHEAAENLTPAQMRAVAGYLASLR